MASVIFLQPVSFAAADVPDELRPHRETTFRGQRWFVLESSSGETMRTIRLYRERT